jgi:cytidylate kinase
MLIYIGGPTGSGKTTLATKLAKLPNIFVIETDRINDKNELKQLSINKMETEEEISSFLETVAAMNQIDIQILIDKAHSHTKNPVIVVVGHLFEVKLKFHKKYFIKIDPMTNYIQFNLRTLDSIIKNADEIKKILTEKHSLAKMEYLIVNKAKVRDNFLIYPRYWLESYKDVNKYAKSTGCKLATFDELYLKISKLSK